MGLKRLLRQIVLDPLDTHLLAKGPLASSHLYEMEVLHEERMLRKRTLTEGYRKAAHFIRYEFFDRYRHQ